MRRPALLLALALLAGPALAFADEPATLTVKGLKELTLRVYGFLETDWIRDSTEGLQENQGNAAVAPEMTAAGAPNYAGLHPRMQASVRNSRLGFELTLPKIENDWRVRGVLELDGLGSGAVNTAPGSSAGAQTERDFFNNPAVRIRHAYIDISYADWNAKIGQYWSLLGWQPHYFSAEPAVAPTPGLLYRRFAQARATNEVELGSGWKVESAADVAKPAQSNSGWPEFHLGMRVSSSRSRSALLSGAGASMEDLSFAASAALVPIRTMIGNENGKVVALDAYLPILGSPDGRSRGGNLAATAEFSSGCGYGGLELSSLSAGVAAVAAAQAGAAVDSGIAGINKSGEVEELCFRTYRAQLQYVLPGGRAAVSAGASETKGTNLGDFMGPANGGGADFVSRKRYGFLALFCDPRPWLRFAAELSETQDLILNDPFNGKAANRRLQLTSYFIF